LQKQYRRLRQAGAGHYRACRDLARDLDLDPDTVSRTIRSADRRAPDGCWVDPPRETPAEAYVRAGRREPARSERRARMVRLGLEQADADQPSDASDASDVSDVVSTFGGALSTFPSAAEVS
jgi:DNA-binding MarR family transcriptional regulator